MYQKLRSLKFRMKLNRHYLKWSLGLMLPIAAGCHTDMWVQPKELPMQQSSFFQNGASLRPLVRHTVARGHLQLDTPFFTGYQNGKLVSEIPIPVTKALIERGQGRFDIFCSPCHGQLGNGKGMIAQRGFSLRTPVASYHTDRLRRMPIGHFFDVITNGYGTMFSYASRIEPQDRWAICAYIRVLQYSEHAPPNEIPASDLKQLAMKSTNNSQAVAER